MNARYGYACINETLKAKGIRPNRQIRKATFQSYTSLEPIKELAYKNLVDTLSIIKWNIENEIYLYRMSSNLFPWMSEYNIESLLTPDIESVLKEIGQLSGQVRLSFHPGAFISLSSPNEQVIQNSIKEINQHAEIMDLMELPKSHWAKINIHIGGAYKEKHNALDRFKSNFNLLSDSAKARLTIENDDRPNLFTTEDLYNTKLPCPIVFDLHHERLNPSNCSIDTAFEMAISTWPKDVRPTMHYSQSRMLLEDSSAKPVAHSDWYYEPCGFECRQIDIMLECKKKELALKLLLDQVQQ